MWQWQPIGGVIWEINNHTAQTVVMIINLTGWVIVFISTYLINDFDLFGLKQTWLNFIDRPSESLPLRLPHFYKIIRHPIYLGFMLAFWSTSTMTVAHMFFALLTTLYILTAIQLEERDLTIHYGGKYIDYKKRMPMIIPFSKRKKVKTS
jgi:protein-S-isoprenylcysteine O-methyltransferase Ste14